jgi:hypothetical protein
MPSHYPPTARTAIGLTCRRWPGIDFSYADHDFWKKNEHFSDVDIHKYAIKYVVIKGTTVNADVGNNPFGSGGNLRIESLQDTSVYHETSQNSGGTLSISAAGVPGGSVTSGSTKIDSNFQSVGQQSAIRAGAGGFNVNVAGKTDLIGGQITSTQKAVDDNKNSFNTQGQLTITNLANAATYSASGSSVTVGIGSELASSGAGAGRATGNANSTTEAAITGVAGNKTARTGDKEAGLQPIFNLEAVKLDVATQIEITKKFGQNASKAVGDFGETKTKPIDDAKRYEDLKGREANLNSQEKAQLGALEQGGLTPELASSRLKDPELLKDYDNWKEGGPIRVLAHGVVGGLGGGVSGAVGAVTSQTVVPLLAAEINKLDIPKELKEGLILAAGAAVGAATGGVTGLAAGVNATGQNYLRHDEALLRAQLTEKLRTCKPAECAELRTQIDRINQLDLGRDQAIAAACSNPSSPECGGLNRELQMALASYKDQDLTAMGLRNASGKVRTLAELYQLRINNPAAYGVATALINSAIGAVTGVGQLTYSLTSAAMGDKQAQQDLRQLVTTVRETISDPSGAIVNQLEAADRADAAGNPAEAARIRTDLLLTVGGTTAGAAALGRSANNLWKNINSLDNALGEVKTTGNGYISTRQLTEEGMPAHLSPAELAELNKMSKAANSTAKGNIGEAVMDSYFERSGYKALDGKCGAQCFDGVYVKDGKVYINEVKPMGADGSIQLSGPNQATGLPTQMSEDWIKDRLIILRDGTPAQKETAKIIDQAMRDKTLVRVVTGVNSSGATMAKVY